ncbi:MAG: hypothetical protein HKM05_04190 [Spirochaetales bacterium]|nr:hypothetical protein [Spirochaetales bacterium]
MSGALRYARDFLLAELKRLRHGWVEPTGSPEALFEKAPLFLDSLELVELAGLLADRFHLREAGLEELLLAYRSLKGWAQILEQARQMVPRVSFLTSGTTGTPKKTTHRWSWLTKEAEFFASQCFVTSQSRLVKAVPSHHIYGLIWTWLVSEVASVEVSELDLVAPRWQTGDVVVTTPFLLHLWLTRGLPVAGTKFILSSAPFPDEDARLLTAQGATFLEVFGSSETAGIGWRTQPDEGFRLLPWWVWTDNRLKRNDEQEQESFEIPDNVTFVSADTLRPTGRKDFVVSIGGVNVNPNQVQKALLHCPLVAKAAVRLGSNGRLKAFIVPIGQAGSDFDAQLRAWASQNLSSPERPASYTWGSELPLSDWGKLGDWTEGNLR